MNKIVIWLIASGLFAWSSLGADDSPTLMIDLNAEPIPSGDCEALGAQKPYIDQKLRKKEVAVLDAVSKALHMIL